MLNLIPTPNPRLIMWLREILLRLGLCVSAAVVNRTRLGIELVQYKIWKVL